MDIRERYAKFVQDEIRENSNPYPTGIQGFIAGVESERERIIALIQANACNIYTEYCEPEASCLARNALVSLIKGENE